MGKKSSTKLEIRKYLKLDFSETVLMRNCGA